MEKALISIIVPVYNTEQYLDECVTSVVSQSYNNLEIILVDDGATDQSPQKCDQWARKDNRIKVIHKENGGLSDARNAGLDNATGEYITFCDSDDILANDTIDSAYGIFMRYNCDIVSYESTLYQNRTENRITYYHKDQDITLLSPVQCLKGMLEVTYDCSCCNKLFKRSIIGSHRFIKGLTNEDILFFFDILPTCANDIIHLNKEFYKYRINLNGITHTFNANSLNAYYNAKYIYEKIIRGIPELKEASRVYLINTAYCIGRMIKKESKQNENPFKDALCDIKKKLFCYLPYIILHRRRFSNKFFFLKCFYVVIS